MSCHSFLHSLDDFFFIPRSFIREKKIGLSPSDPSSKQSCRREGLPAAPHLHLEMMALCLSVLGVPGDGTVGVLLVGKETRLLSAAPPSPRPAPATGFPAASRAPGSGGPLIWSKSSIPWEQGCGSAAP